MSPYTHLNARIVQLQEVIQRCDKCARSLTQVDWIQALCVHNSRGHQDKGPGILIELAPSLQK
jgi:hypothetical protein